MSETTRGLPVLAWREFSRRVGHPPCFGRFISVPLWSRPSACAAFARALATDITNHTTLVSGYLGSLNDEERSEMRYLM